MSPEGARFGERGPDRLGLLGVGRLLALELGDVVSSHFGLPAVKIFDALAGRHLVTSRQDPGECPQPRFRRAAQTSSR